MSPTGPHSSRCSSVTASTPRWWSVSRKRLPTPFDLSPLDERFERLQDEGDHLVLPEHRGVAEDGLGLKRPVPSALTGAAGHQGLVSGRLEDKLDVVVGFPV